jgi:LPXTG-site transpeptidase (sortase) family protein
MPKIQTDQAIAYLKAGQLSAYRAAVNVLNESKSQYTSSARDVRSMLWNSRGLLKNGGRATWAFLTQPVWIVTKNKAPKQYSRGSLFVLDTVRFGGTFAALFVALFLSLNYQSFWAIIGSQIRPIQAAQNSTALVSSVDEALRSKVMRSPTLAVSGKMAGDLLSFLPDVGPPENRIIIPKLNLNVPLVTPSYQNLLSENWTGVEEDIQDALQHGIVHYPGTARPGQAGNFFVTGHSSYYPWAPGKYKNVFARLHEIDVGDEYWVYYGGDKHRYVVREKQEVKPSNVRVLDQPLDKRTATLMTCTPVGTTLRRLIVTAEEVDSITGMPLEVGEKGSHGGQKLNVEQLPI